MCLSDIKLSFENLNVQKEEIDIQDICNQMTSLKNEISTLVQKMQQQEQSKNESIKDKVSSESVALMQSLLLLIT
ncbi:hypothetical protein BJ095_10534 [Ureibacillus chungkukjangi]|uniref:Uncharacterized protein n=2 Tax=Ureibacillus chungkukjangi TaxID=1202712 RepID=A0A318TRL5_9BACL|nr:hypothetical protein BJ095_10534 [Ureibacillus chungkukjangi]